MNVRVEWTEGKWTTLNGRRQVVAKKVYFKPEVWEGTVAATTVTGARIAAAKEIEKRIKLQNPTLKYVAVFICNIIDLDQHAQVTIWEWSEEIRNQYAKGVV